MSILPPPYAAVADYFQRRRSSLSAFMPEDILHNERLWHVEICGLPEETFIPGPVITREQAQWLDDPFSDKRRFGPIGEYAKCRRCHAVFESRGLGLCSTCSQSSSGKRVRECEECGASLPPGSRKDLRFCSDRCRQKAHRRDLSVTDNSEGGTLTAKPSKAVTTTQENRGLPDPEIRNAHPSARCPTCNRPFQPPRKDAKFCSDACRQRAYRQQGPRRRAQFEEAAA